MTSRTPVFTSDIPEVPSGTVLTLRPVDWSHCAHVTPGTYLDVTVVRVHRTVTAVRSGALWVWIAGHQHPECTWAHVERHAPCRHLMVRVDVLRRAVGQ
ncbi:hypothetical protein [Plantactinospora sp. CA-290183]|uniref:hypothetical protein n=1 Tax=Plantactinospora sp. CA-290183 TaxID=3240006 RepID=UPI003D94299D